MKTLGQPHRYKLRKKEKNNTKLEVIRKGNCSELAHFAYEIKCHLVGIKTLETSDNKTDCSLDKALSVYACQNNEVVISSTGEHR